MKIIIVAKLAMLTCALNFCSNEGSYRPENRLEQRSNISIKDREDNLNLDGAEDLGQNTRVEIFHPGGSNIQRELCTNKKEIRLPPLSSELRLSKAGV